MIRFSLMFFSANAETLGAGKYRLVVDAATFADRHGFEAVWLPERHFGLLGGLYPNPSVLHSALAMVTERVALRAGSVVLPLHHPIRVAEEWSMVDNLSAGRVGLSFASGWNPNDFALFPERYERRREVLFEELDTVHRLWRGEAIEITKGGGGKATIEIYPKPVQKELPTWITAARSPQTFERAGTLGANVLSHLLDQDVEALAEKIVIYREARARAGHDAEGGTVTAMLHTFVLENEEAAREEARDPYCAFLKANAGLLKGLAESRDQSVDLDSVSPEDQDAFVRFLYERFAGSRALIGSPQSCIPLVEALHQAGVDEIACLLDFGPTNEQVMRGLPSLEGLATLSARELSARSSSVVDAAPSSEAKEQGQEHVSDLDTIRDRCGHSLSGKAFYERLSTLGLEKAQRILQSVALNEHEALAEIAAEIDVGSSWSQDAALDPVLLEACLQAAQAAAPEFLGAQALWLVSHVGALKDVVPGTAPRYLHAVRSEYTGRQQVEVRLLGERGDTVGRLVSIRLRALAKPPIVPSALEEGDLEGRYYEMAWQPRALPASREQQEGWCIVADRGGQGRRLAEALEGLGHTCRLIESESLPDSWSREDADRMVDQMLESSETPCGHLVFLPALDSQLDEQTSVESLDRDQVRGPGAALLLMQALIERAGTRAPKLHLVTRGAQAVGERSVPLSPIQSTLWGLGKTCAMEHPDIWGGLIDLDPAADEHATSEALLQVLLVDDGEDQVVFRDGQRHVARLTRRPAPHASLPPVRENGTYLITGGLWGIGLEVARWLLSTGARSLVLLGRSELPPAASWDELEPGSRTAELVEALRDLRRDGAAVRYEALDVTDELSLIALLERLTRSESPLRGIVHAASVWRDQHGETLIRPILQSDLVALEQVFRPKVLGSWLLHRHTRNLDLDFFCLFSSAASLSGSAGQGSYAAASGFLDTLAHERVRLGLPALAVNLGPVSGAGFGATSEGLKVHTYWEANGLARITPPQLLAALGALLREGTAQAGFMRFDWQAIARFFPALYKAPWASRLVEAVAASAEPSAFLAELRAVAASERIDLLIRHLQQRVAEVMSLEAGRLPETHKKLFDMGVDSLMSIELKNRLQSDFETEVPITAVFNYPTIDALGRYVASELLGLEDAAESGAERVAPTAGAKAAEAALERMHEMSDQEVERMLEAKLTAGLAQ